MSIVSDIKSPIEKELKEFEVLFRKSMKTKVALLDKVMHYIVKRKGKQMRPMFVFLVAKMMNNEEINERSYRAAALIELLHTATLVHDDVVDDANERRGFFSVNALWKNKIAVLVGDYLLSKGLLLSVENEDFDLLKIVSEAVKEMSEGELLQIEKARRLDITEEVYFDIIRQKTASLIASCCAAGAASVGQSAEEVEKLRLIGETIGIAFQIKDDLFDYNDSRLIGKPTGIDIKEQKMTLPLIYTLSKAEKKTKKWMINVVKKHNENPKKVAELIDYVKANGGIEYTTQKMNEYKQKAIDLLADCPNGASKDSLLALIDYTTNRKK